jgi:uncharacterized RDD family membrane protein YckC
MTNQENQSKNHEEQSPYSPPTAEMSEIISDNEELELAGRGARLLAHIADGFIILIPFIFLGMAVSFVGLQIENLDESESPLMGGGILFLVALIMLGILAINWLWLYRNGQTIGKRIMSIKIVRTDGNRAELLRIIFLRFSRLHY